MRHIIPDWPEYHQWLVLSGLPIAMWILGAVLVNRFVNWAAVRVTQRIDAEFAASESLVRTESAKHQHAVIQVVSWGAIAIIYLYTSYSVIKLLGVSITALVAPATVLGAALGFGAQRVVQDLLAGFFIITEKQYGFGDVVELSVAGGVPAAAGTVEDVTLRITKIRSGDGEVITVPNGQIVKATNLSKDWARAVVDIPLPTNVDMARVNQLLHEVGTKAYADPRLQPLLLDVPSLMGVESIDLEQVNLRMVARTLPGKQFDVGRSLRERIILEFSAAGIALLAEPSTTDAAVQE